MERYKNNFETYQPYEVELLELEGVKNMEEVPQLAYAVNQDNFKILVGKSGHAQMMRSRDKHSYEGGWIFPKKIK